MLNRKLVQVSDEHFENNSDYESLRGLYNSMQFVLRLNSDIHDLLDKTPTGIIKATDIDFDTFQVFSTYLHETVHWWQHMGSTAGLLVSLTYPAQSHLLSHTLLTKS